MARIFISYRKYDTVGVAAGRLYDFLCRYFGQDRIFMDIGGIAAGDDFPRVIKSHLDDCQIVIAFIGERWTEILREKEQDGTNDYLRFELETAIKWELRIIPVLVDEATIPKPSDLPMALRPLVNYQMFKINNKHFYRDAENLLVIIQRNLTAKLYSEVEIISEKQFYQLFLDAVEGANERVYLTNLSAPPAERDDSSRVSYFGHVDELISAKANVNFRRIYGLPNKEYHGWRDRGMYLTWLGEQLFIHERNNNFQARIFDFGEVDKNARHDVWFPLLSVQIIDQNRLLIVDMEYNHHPSGGARVRDLWCRGEGIVQEFLGYYERFWRFCKRIKDPVNVHWDFYLQLAQDYWGDNLEREIPREVTTRLRELKLL